MIQRLIVQNMWSDFFEQADYIHHMNFWLLHIYLLFNAKSLWYFNAVGETVTSASATTQFETAHKPMAMICDYVSEEWITTTSLYVGGEPFTFEPFFTKAETGLPESLRKTKTYTMLKDDATESRLTFKWFEISEQATSIYVRYGRAPTFLNVENITSQHLDLPMELIQWFIHLVISQLSHTPYFELGMNMGQYHYNRFLIEVKAYADAYGLQMGEMKVITSTK